MSDSTNETVSEITKDILKEYIPLLKEKVIEALKKERSHIVQEIVNDIDLDELLEQEIGEEMDLEVWERDIKSIFETIDETETLDLEVLNDKFQQTIQLLAAMIAQMRVHGIRLDQQERLISSSDGYNGLQNLAKNLLNGSDDDDQGGNLLYG